MKKQLFARLAAISAGSAVMVGNAFAAVPTEVSTELATAKTDAVSVAGLVITIVVAIAAFLFMRRAIK